MPLSVLQAKAVCQANFLYLYTGAGFASRQMANLAKPSLSIAVDEQGFISMKAVTTFKTLEIKFKLDEEFDETTADDRKVRVRIKYVGYIYTYKYLYT